jgi:glycosyltransferase involved in cell wall biosynthesis
VGPAHGRKFLFEVRDLWPKFAIAVGVLKNRLLIRLSLWLEGFLYRRADQVVVNSPGYVAHVKERGARRVELVPNGSNPEMFDPADKGATFRGRHGLGDAFVVLYAGAHGMSNGLDLALDAAGILAASRPEVRLVFLGDGKEKNALQKEAQSLGLVNVLFLPPAPKNEMAESLAGADACLAILKPLEEYKTTYPNKVFDYMAAGRPVVLAIDGVIREVVEAAECGIFALPGDPAALAVAIGELVQDRPRSRRMGLAGRKYLEENFNRDQIAGKLLAILNDMLIDKKTHAGNGG